ncbi:hypothetical protein CERZMDRAFT_86418 [Cercospora zeae-maydis SCOH1-5]|uniref:Uncharacterized protein n=1 Tax=Cercospora zeae-maydis SCOH1-5 TaxID=717836 RepID=A0A6A6F9P3_9PEZI|nr:hypothetical protein CERZMDRAFT_86418 [Cercospora zeae-maydis SCOH1-5]
MAPSKPVNHNIKSTTTVTDRDVREHHEAKADQSLMARITNVLQGRISKTSSSTPLAPRSSSSAIRTPNTAQRHRSIASSYSAASSLLASTYHRQPPPQQQAKPKPLRPLPALPKSTYSSPVQWQDTYPTATRLEEQNRHKARQDAALEQMVREEHQERQKFREWAKKTIFDQSVKKVSKGVSNAAADASEVVSSVAAAAAVAESPANFDHGSQQPAESVAKPTHEEAHVIEPQPAEPAFVQQAEAVQAREVPQAEQVEAAQVGAKNEEVAQYPPPPKTYHLKVSPVKRVKKTIIVSSSLPSTFPAGSRQVFQRALYSDGTTGWIKIQVIGNGAVEAEGVKALPEDRKRKCPFEDEFQSRKLRLTKSLGIQWAQKGEERQDDELSEQFETETRSQLDYARHIVGVLEAKLSEVGPEQGNFDEAEPGEVESGEVESGEIDSAEVEPTPVDVKGIDSAEAEADGNSPNTAEASNGDRHATKPNEVKPAEAHSAKSEPDEKSDEQEEEEEEEEAPITFSDRLYSFKGKPIIWVNQKKGMCGCGKRQGIYPHACFYQWFSEAARRRGHGGQATKSAHRTQKSTWAASVKQAAAAPANAPKGPRKQNGSGYYVAPRQAPESSRMAARRGQMESAAAPLDATIDELTQALKAQKQAARPATTGGGAHLPGSFGQDEVTANLISGHFEAEQVSGKQPPVKNRRGNRGERAAPEQDVQMRNALPASVPTGPRNRDNGRRRRDQFVPESSSAPVRGPVQHVQGPHPAAEDDDGDISMTDESTAPDRRRQRQNQRRQNRARSTEDKDGDVRMDDTSNIPTGPSRSAKRRGRGRPQNGDRYSNITMGDATPSDRPPLGPRDTNFSRSRHPTPQPQHRPQRNLDRIPRNAHDLEREENERRRMEANARRQDGTRGDGRPPRRDVAAREVNENDEVGFTIRGAAEERGVVMRDARRKSSKSGMRWRELASEAFTGRGRFDAAGLRDEISTCSTMASESHASSLIREECLIVSHRNTEESKPRKHKNHTPSHNICHSLGNLRSDGREDGCVENGSKTRNEARIERIVPVAFEEVAVSTTHHFPQSFDIPVARSCKRRKTTKKHNQHSDICWARGGSFGDEKKNKCR